MTFKLDLEEQINFMLEKNGEDQTESAVHECNTWNLDVSDKDWEQGRLEGIVY